MRFFSKPAKGRLSGNTLSTSQEPPGRNGASHNSHARPSTIIANRLATASKRVSCTWGWGTKEEEFIEVAS